MSNITKLTLSSHPGKALVIEERIEFHGHGWWLSLGPSESALVVRLPPPESGGGSILLLNHSDPQALGLHIAEGAHNTRVGNAVLFGTWDRKSKCVYNSH